MKNLTLLLAISLACHAAASEEATAAESFHSEAWLAENADILRAEEFLSSIHRVAEWVPEDLKDPALTKVTHDFGKTVIQMDRLPIRSGRGDAQPKTWSSYWYPLYERDLFQSEDPGVKSVMEKYDLVAADRNPKLAGKAVAFEKMRFSDAVNRWEGLCDAWSIAAVSMPEPKEPVTVVLTPDKILLPPPPAPKPAPLKPGEKPKPVVPPEPQYKIVERKVTFSVSDQKALLLKTFEGMDSSGLQVYGQRFTGKPSETINGLSYGWIQPDIFPDQFHRFMEVVVFQRKQSFVMDHDPSEAVWSEPVDGASYEILPVPGRNDQVFVRAFLYPAKQLRKEERNNTGKNEHVREYDYILGGSVDWSHNLTVEYGIWLNKSFLVNSPDYKDKTDFIALVHADSRVSHPDFVYTVNEASMLNRKTVNPELSVKLIDLLLKNKL